MTIRAATVNDIPLIRGIAHATWPVAYRTILSPAQLSYMLHLMYSEVALTEQLTAKDHHFLLAWERDAAVGFAGFEHMYRNTRRTRLHKLYVLPATQGAGTGAALLRAVELAALEAGDKGVELNVNRFNPARDWYAKRGFRIERDEVIDIGQGFVMDDHVMVKSLPSQ
ncbi:MAG: GNAT family N-acetyltransferase [Flavobacteriales bacterium]|nr:GNAT family N-acetyltransferase [Flavobacteriales bacterium]